ncbi:protein of unknown function (DUF1883) [Aciduliprofundum sp. MAR08-339]|uniref:PLDc N-terminal domain-containing protein n=1 Tax=Aciduliprofundum sp. (strain MAR08-339) TaxID=673860 RepID=UPI0002A4C7AB|nr:protein of unknown function (DUF1883) [Aciduliprofundum sp. MAR08-339]
MNGKSSSMVVVVSLIFLALLVTPVALGEDVNSDSGNVSISENQYWYHLIGLPNGGGIRYTIKATGSVNAYLLDENNFQKYAAGQRFVYISGGSVLSVQNANVQYYVNSSAGGKYYLVVESAAPSSVSFSYSLKYGKDVELSIGEFLGSLGGKTCILGMLFFVVWLLVLIWVYRDAKRRGKSGLVWFLVVLILNIIGLIIWLIVRPKNRVR